MVCISLRSPSLSQPLVDSDWAQKMTTVKQRKANGYGHTYKVGNSWKTAIRKDGRVVTATAKTAAESRKRAQSKSLLPQEGKSLGAKFLAGPFFKEWLECEHKESIAASTYKRYDSLLRTHILPALGKIELARLTRTDLSRVLSQMAQHKQSPRSQQQARALLLVACKKAYEAGYIESNPSLGLRNIKVRGKEFSPLSIEEVRRLLSTYEGTYICARLHIALLCGLRQGEALGLQWSDINWAQNSLTVKGQVQKVDGKYQFVHLKTARSYRTIYMTDETIKALKFHQSLVEKMESQSVDRWPDIHLVFPKSDGSPRSPKTDYDEWHKALKLCGIAPRRLHDARHTAATLMYSQSIGIEIISRALGHSSSAITSRLYVHSAEEPLRNAAEALNLLFE